jgi:hypothetical protein
MVRRVMVASVQRCEGILCATRQKGNKILQIKPGSWPNGIKLASEFLLDQLLTQYLPGFDHEREALGAPLLDARLHPGDENETCKIPDRPPLTHSECR